MGVHDEEELLNRWRTGDREAGSQLFERYFDSLYRFFAAKASRDVEDMIQQTLLACIEGRDRIESARAYVFGTARNVLYRYYRRNQQERFDALRTSLEDVAPSAGGQVDAAIDSRLLAAALRRIPLDLQIALELHYWERLTHAELAEALEVSLGVAKGRLQAAKKQVREQLKKLKSGGEFGDLGAIDVDRWRPFGSEDSPA